MQRKHSQKFWIVLALSCLTAAAMGIGGTLAYLNWQTKTDTEYPKPTNGNDTTPAPFYFTTMTHMEGSFKDNLDRDLYLRHVEQMRWAMDLFDDYGAKLTFESEASFAQANSNWGLNILQEVIDSGHGVGTHADFGAAGRPLSLTQLTERFEANKLLIDNLVGAENNRGVSGGTGPTDWVIAASRAGFDYMDAVTGFGYLSMDINQRPDGWTDGYIRNVTYHDAIPVEFEKRIYPMVLKNAKDLEPDADGILTVMNGDIGELASLAEGRSTCAPNCIFDQDDVDAVFAAIEEANTIRDTALFTRLNIHIPLELLKEENEALLRDLLAGIETYVSNGTLQWGTQLQAYEAYNAWRNR